MNQKSEVKLFPTEDVVALYLGKTFGNRQMPQIKKIVEFLTGNQTGFAYSDTDRHNRIRQILAKQHNWLGSVRYNHSNFKDWIKNITRNHGQSLEVTK